MTEHEWRTGDELWRMLHHAIDSGLLSARRQFLYAIAACRQRGPALPPVYHPMLDQLETTADRPEMPFNLENELIGWNRLEPLLPVPPLLEQLLTLQHSARQALQERAAMILEPGAYADEGDPRFDADFAVLYATLQNPFAASFGNGKGSIMHSPAEAQILRDIVGNPFRPVQSEPTWLTPTVVALAEGIYAERAFDRLPILADALEDAGCDQPDVLAHCRGDGPHVRGCWVVDLVLGKC